MAGGETWDFDVRRRIFGERCYDQKFMRRFAGPGMLFFITVLFHWKLVLTNQYTWLESGDIGSLILPWFQFQAGVWHHLRFPLWDPNSWTGQPLFGQAQPGSAYPLNWLLFWMPLDHGWLRQDVLHWWYVLVHYLAGLTAYALCRDLGRSRLASVLGGVIFSLGGYVASVDSPQMLHGAIWAPLVLLFLFRAERGERPLANALLSGFFLGITFLAGHHQMQIFLSIAVVAMWIWICARNRKLISAAVLSLLIAAMASAFQTVPAAEYGRLAVRWVGTDQPQGLGEKVPYAVHVQYGLKPISLLGIFVAGVEDHPYNAFVGVAALSFAICGAILGWRDRRARWLAAIGVGGIVFALGGNSVFHGMIYAMAPMVEKARVPAAATLIFAVGLAPLAAFGLDALRDGRGGAVARTLTWILAGFAAVLAIGSLMFYAAKVPMVDDRIIITAFCSLLAAVLLAAWRANAISSRAGAIAALALVLFELANVTDYNLATADRVKHPYLYTLAQHYDLVRYVRAQGELARVVYDAKTINYNIGDWYGIEALNAYAASVPASLWNHLVLSDRVEDIIGVRYYFGLTPQRSDLHEVFQGASGVKVFENRKAFPRAWAVHHAVRLENDAESRAMLADPKFDARNKVFTVGEDPPKLDACDMDDVWLHRHEPNYVLIEASMNCRGMVILTDTWFPGWRAFVDGREALIEKAYGAFRGVVVDGGSHKIEMRCRPASVYIGAALTLASGAIVLLAFRNGRPKPPRVKIAHAYFPAFDVFRGIGILFVIFAHTPTKHDSLAILRPIGILGVHMFFALSGFLITHRLLEEYEQTGKVDLRSFYWRRARRILPPAVIYLTILALLGPALHFLPANLSEIIASLLFFRNIYQAPSPDGWYTGHFWSLSLEEQFYFVWPVLLALIGPATRRLRIVAIAIIAATAIWRAYVFAVHPAADIYRPDLLADHLVWGCLIALVWHRVLQIREDIRAIAGIAGIAVAAGLIYWQPHYWQPFFAMATAVGFIFAAKSAESWSAKWKPFRKLGEASYDCYIWQSLFLPLPFAAMALPIAQRFPWSYFLIAIVTAASFWLTFPKRRAQEASTLTAPVGRGSIGPNRGHG